MFNLQTKLLFILIFNCTISSTIEIVYSHIPIFILQIKNKKLISSIDLQDYFFFFIDSSGLCSDTNSDFNSNNSLSGT